MKNDDFPALFRSADLASAAAQSTYFWLLRLQYGLLLLAAVCALGFTASSDLYVAYAAAVAASSAILAYMSIRKPEKDWYSCRALAESVKTLTWRYMMRADPYKADVTEAEAKRRFTETLHSLLHANQHTQQPISRRPMTGEQITAAMQDFRTLSLEERKQRYRAERVEDQCDWYVGKARANRLGFQLWVAACIAVQTVAIATALLRIRYEFDWILWPTEPLLVLAASIVGWIQVRKFNELASAYSLTAHEIGLVLAQVNEIALEDELSAFVNEAELAFSREHTQWVARQNP